jgi:hypothetical protein
MSAPVAQPAMPGGPAPAMPAPGPNVQGPEPAPSPYRSFYSIFHTVVAVFAIYLAFKCNGGFDFGGFLLACCCPYIYIIYKFATSETFCGIRG